MPDDHPSHMPADIPYWFISFARHVLRTCTHPGRYHIILDIPVSKKRPREIQISLHQRLRIAHLQTKPPAGPNQPK